MSRARIFIDTTPKTKRGPVWNSGVFYVAGSIVSRDFPNPLDSENSYYNYYVNKSNVIPGEPPPELNPNWTLWISTDPALPNLFSDSEIYDFIEQNRQQYQTRYNDVDSDVVDLLAKIESLSDIDSELGIIDNRLRDVEEKNVIDSLFDSERRDQHAIVWDSDANKFKFSPLVKTINSKLPDEDGNVEVVFAKTIIGTRDDRPDSEEDGSIFIVRGDSEEDVNGITFMYVEGPDTWVRIIGYTDIENDLLYVKASGDTMTGPLRVNTPVLDSEVATKKYVDTYSNPTKQDLFIIYDSEGALTTADSDVDGSIARVTQTNTLWLRQNGVYVKFTIPTQNYANPSLIDAVVDVPTRDVKVTSYRLSSQELGTLTLTKNGFPQSVLLVSNITGSFVSTGVFNNVRLLNAVNQEFTIRTSEAAFDTNAVYILTYTTHDGIQSQIRIRTFPTNRVAFSNTGSTLNYGEY